MRTEIFYLGSSRQRKVLGWIGVNERSLGLVEVGAHIHFEPTFVRLAGWSPGWTHSTMKVQAIYRNPVRDTTHVIVDRWANGYRAFTLDRQGRYAEDRGDGSPGINVVARNACATILPLFVDEDEQTLCPFCGRATRYRRGFDYCDRTGHGIVPNHTEPGLVAQYGTAIVPTWVLDGPQQTSSWRRSFGVGASDEASVPNAPNEGDRCLSCGNAVYEWVTGTLKCPACWHRPLARS